MGATTDEGASVTARMSIAASDVQLRVTGPGGSTTTTAVATDSDRCVRLDVTGLAADTVYTYEILSAGLVHSAGRFRTHPAASGSPASFTIAFSGDAVLGSQHPVFRVIRESNPLMFIHMGDRNYENIATNNPALFHAAHDGVMASATQAALYSNVPTAYVWDDHDFGANNSNGTSASKPAAASVYRQRVPHYPLVHATAIYQTWDIGRVRFIMTDQRSESAASGTILGATQLAWFKDLLENSPGKLIVWVCPRWFALANHADSWNSFATERTEICDHIKAHAHGRVVVLEADQHTLAIDDGSHVDHATGGGEPLRCFRAAPLDQTVSALAGTYSHGEFNNRGQWGEMAVTDSGGSIGVTWNGYDSSGTLLTTYSFSVSV